MSLLRLFGAAAALATVSAWAQQLPDGPGKAETQKLCTQCHELARAVSLREDRSGWQATVQKMVALGAKASDSDLEAVVTYLSIHFPADAVPPLKVNTARQIEFESALNLKRSQAAAIIAYREKHGAFKSLADLEKVPGIDVAKIEASKDRLLFQ
jgi:competence ComEA-like helix-hairpin-helix protein